MQNSRKMLILGSGPSTRELVDWGLDKLPADIDTFGMGAQYRFYREINWWPTYYALADAKVVFSHRSDLANIVQDPGVTTERFFFSWPVCEHPRLKLINHLSTGDFCLRKSVEMGYRDIYLIGIEGQYVEEIAESRPLSREEYLELGFGQLDLPEALMRTMRIITRTPEENPNYFFNDYQREGDVYTLPHSHAHRARVGDAADFALSTGTRVTNLSQRSMIQDFPRSTLSTLIGGPGEDDVETGETAAGSRSSQWYGPFSRRDAKRVDESRIVFELFESGIIPRTRERAVMFDVGACRGDALRAFADRQWTVHAFEPNPPLFEGMSRAFDLPTVTLNELAVSDESKQGLSFFTSEQSAGISSLMPFHDTHEETASVDSVTLDEYLEQAQVDRIDYLKIDAEGFDLNVLRGIDMARHPVEVVLCEFEDRKTRALGYDFHDLAAILQAAGLTVYMSEWHPVVRYGGRHQWRVLKKYPCQPEVPDAWGNLFGFRTDPGIHTLSGAVRDDLLRFDALDTNVRVQQLRQELAEVYASKSWRLTAPLRGLFSMGRKLRSRGH
jgi:FkbM family methyltransferase